MAVTQSGIYFTGGADGDVISGKFPLAAVMLDSSGASGACVIKINGASGNIIYSATPTNSVISWFVPCGGEPLIVDDFCFATIGANVTIRAVKGLISAIMPEQASLS